MSSLSSSIRTPASSGWARIWSLIWFSFRACAGSADDEGFDRLEDFLSAGGFGERPVRGDRFAQQGVERRRVTALDAVDRERCGEHRGALDVGRLAVACRGDEIMLR